MIVAIRIKGDVNIDPRIKETLYRIRLRRKYSCVVIKPDPVSLGVIKKLTSFIAYGEINEETLHNLIEKRGKPIDKKKKIDVKKVVEEIKKGKKFEDLNLKPFFRLHPPRGGIDSGKHFGVKKGVLGNNREHINKLIERML
ncbi:MAG: uL30 family ribosomal protein [Nanoarchaeota archaeon]